MSDRLRKTLAVNAITFSRVPLIAAFSCAVVVARRTGSAAWAVAAAALLSLAGFSDLFDGMLARRWRVVSRFGKMADPLMDKVFFIVAFPTLLWLAGTRGEDAFHPLLLLAFTVLYVLRDQWVTFLRSVASAYGADVGALFLGKLRTALSFPSAGLIYLSLAFGDALPDAFRAPVRLATYGLEIFLIALNGLSFVVYTRVYLPYVRRALAQGGDGDRDADGRGPDARDTDTETETGKRRER